MDEKSFEPDRLGSAAPALRILPGIEVRYTMTAPPMSVRPLEEAHPKHLGTEAWSETPLLWLATALDATIVQAMRTVVDRFLIPEPDHVHELRRSAEPFLAGRFASAPHEFLSFDELPAEPTRVSERVVRRSDSGVVVRRKLYTATDPDDPIRLEHWMHQNRRPTATMLLLHGFTMGRPRMDAPLLMARDWFAHGLDVALLTLPFHGARTPPSSRFSGDRFATPDISGLNEAAARAVYEILLTTRWLRERWQIPTGLLGLSLGGYLGATVAGLDPELAFAIPVVPPVCFGDLAWRFLSASSAARGAHATTLAYDELRLALRVHSPLSFPLAIPRARVLIVGGRGDRIVPTSHPHSLWRHWEEPRIHWFSGSHLAPFGRRGIVQAVLEHLERLGLVER